MAKNDVILLDGIIDDRIEVKLPSDRRDEAFEYLAFEQILKDYDLSNDEILHGSVDGRNDGGIDGFFILVNGHMVIDLENFTWPRSGAQLEIWIITCKHHDTFKQATLDNLAASISELFDFSVDNENLKSDYSNDILLCRENFKFVYRKLSSKMNNFTINFSYASRGDTTDIGESIISRSKQIESISKDSFGNVNVSFNFHGCTELVDLCRKVPNFSLELPVSEVLTSGERYILLANLVDYYNFVTDDNKLRRYLFDSNVRDFMGLNRVNEDIKSTLEDKNSPDFWWLNNGVTILATSASLIGKTIQLNDIQIVNGLQTTESIYRYFKSMNNISDSRSVLIKVIVSQDDNVRDTIIRATNNQTDVEISSLHATDKIQRDIEDILERHDLYYERRKNYYINLGHSKNTIITPLSLASGYINLMLKSPYKASILKSRFMRSEESYNMVFSDKVPLLVWPKIALILKITDETLEELRPIKKSANEKFLKRWRHITSLITISRLLNKFDFKANDLIHMNITNITKDEIKKTFVFMNETFPDLLDKNQSNTKMLYLALCKEAATKFNIKNINILERINEFQAKGPSKNKKVEVSLELVSQINALLPNQPWKPGVHKSIIKEVKCTNNEYFSAVNKLIEDGLRNKQVDGVVYDQDGNVISFDEDRVDSNTLELKNT
ncbi:abortive phage resistance protein [Aliarcobacter butzleri]|uniref:AIPR family protein n=1 Tax=Aliarcobacter butzleri TaxID=28197 RepID=UPI00102D727A|nr:AIPR family protein [Aliarcobacter butzleri]RZV14515.1 abortive phage resistance protein [Aliarcobacter butzleri]